MDFVELIKYIIYGSLIRYFWIDQISVEEWLIEVVSIKLTFSVKTTWVKAINKTRHLKVIGQHFLSKF